MITQNFSKIHLIAEVDGECFLFVENYAPAHARRLRPNWQNDHIPNWPHLKTRSDKDTQKYVTT